MNTNAITWVHNQHMAFSARLRVCPHAHARFPRHKLPRRACLKHKVGCFICFTRFSACKCTVTWQKEGQHSHHSSQLQKRCLNPQPLTPPLSDRRGHSQARGPPPLAPVICPLTTGHLTHRRKRVEFDVARAPNGVSPLESHGGQGSPACATRNKRCCRLSFDQAADQCSNNTVFRVPLLWSPHSCHHFVVYTVDSIACWSPIQALLLATVGHCRAAWCATRGRRGHFLRDVLLLVQRVKEICRRRLHRGLAGWRLHGLRRCCELMECLRAAGRRINVIDDAMCAQVLLE